MRTVLNGDLYSLYVYQKGFVSNNEPQAAHKDVKVVGKGKAVGGDFSAMLAKEVNHLSGN